MVSTLLGTQLLKIEKKNPGVDKPLLAESLAIISGSIILFIGLARLGFIVEFISLAAICGYITGSAFNIGIGQIPGLLGISSTYVNNRAETYKVVINTLKNLRHTKLDAATGLTALFMLYFIKYGFAYLTKKVPKYKRSWFFASTLRTIFVILLYTLISWLMNRHHRSKPRISILGHVPRGM